MTNKLKEAADKFVDTVYGAEDSVGKLSSYADFCSGAEWARKEALEMLRSDSAGKYEYEFELQTNDRLSPGRESWADYLEQQWKE